MRKLSPERSLDRQTLVGLATQMKSDPDGVPAEGVQKAPEAERSTPGADRPEYLVRTRPTRRWPNALEAPRKRTAERSR
jgi:hypothetical protein